MNATGCFHATTNKTSLSIQSAGVLPFSDLLGEIKLLLQVSWDKHLS